MSEFDRLTTRSFATIMSRRPFYIRYRGLLISASAVIVATFSMAMAWTGHRGFTIVFLLTFPVFLVGAVFHFVDGFRRLRKGPNDPSW